MTPIQFALGFIDTFSLKKLFVTLILIALLGGVFTAFEYYTSYFHLSKIERGADILEDLVATREKHTLTPVEEAQRLSLLSDLEPSQLGWSMSLPSFQFNFRFDKLLYGGILWSIIGGSMVLSQGKQKVKENIIMTIFGSLFFGFLSVLSPFDNFFMMIFGAPILIMFLFVILVVIAAKMTKKNEEPKIPNKIE